MIFSEFLQHNIVRLDGGMGTLLQERGLRPGQLPERWNLTHPEVITDIHRAYFDAGCHVATANTFGANALKFSPEELEEVIGAAIRCAKAAAGDREDRFVALDVGPLGRLLKPLGDLDFEDAVRIFAQTVRLGQKHGADLILMETLNDCYETKAAVLAARENSSLPVVVSNAYGEDGKLMTGATPGAMVAMLEGLGVDAIGANCSLGPRQLAGVVEELLEKASVPVLLQPNAGLPRLEDGKTVFDVTPEEFAGDVAALVKKGVRLAGGCCGTTPAHIAALNRHLADLSPVPVVKKGKTVVSSYTHAVEFSHEPLLIGERINPTGKKRFRQALLENDLDYLLNEGISQQEKGAAVLDVNVGVPGLDEKTVLPKAVFELQAVSDLPLQIDTTDLGAMEAALRRYNGKAMVNSVNGKQESMETVFPLVKKYGGVVVALTLDENGIPETAEGRVAVARKILRVAAEYGIDKKDIVFDTLAMTVSADNHAALATLAALRQIRQELDCHTVLGVSNVSFGLPGRDAVNGVFFALALENGLSAAIMNPYSGEMMKTYFAYRALKGLDENCADYIRSAADLTTAPAAPAPQKAPEASGSELRKAIVKGLAEQAAARTEALLGSTDPMELINGEIIPALNTVGKGFEEKTVYLPQLLMSAEAAQKAFGVIKAHVSAGEKPAAKGTFVLATVHGDIHDIGKNIVRLLLENYGFDVVDLGRDVPPQVIVDKVVELRAPLAGLSALMTTTVPAMEKTVALLRQQAPWCKVVVGGAVLTEEYAQKMGAQYAKDAMQTVRYAQEITESIS